MADKSLPYDVLKKVMATCTDADYGKISLAVLQKRSRRPRAGLRRRRAQDAGTFLPKL